MGCDGGTIPTRDELVKLKKKPEKKDKDADLATKWQHCALTQEKLRPPIVACELGRLYNKESVLEFLLDRSKFEECASSFTHLKSLKDVKELNLTENPDFIKGKIETGGGYKDCAIAQYVCPVVGLEMNGRYSFVVMWGCGCVVSQRSMKEVKTDVCHKCGKAYDPKDITVLNGTEEEVKLLLERMEERKAKAKLEKKAKKAQKHKTSEETPADSTQVSNEATESKGKVTNGIPVKKSKLANGKQEDKVDKPSIQKDPRTSKIFKDLFTTSNQAKSRKTAHWVTYNPQYF